MIVAEQYPILIDLGLVGVGGGNDSGVVVDTNGSPFRPVRLA